MYEDITKSLDKFDAFLNQLTEVIDVDVMPGEFDFTNSFLPQQPFNSCLFNLVCKNERHSVNLVTNPHQFEMNGLKFLGTSGQNVLNMLL